MIDSLIGACEALVSVIIGKDPGPTTRISRVGMPNGFFLNDLLWFGDGASRKTAISRGFTVEPGEISAFSVTQLNDLHERLRILLGVLGEEFAFHVQWSIDSDYHHELEAYHRETLNLRRQDPVYGQFGVLIFHTPRSALRDDSQLVAHIPCVPSAHFSSGSGCFRAPYRACTSRLSRCVRQLAKLFESSEVQAFALRVEQT